MRKQHDTTEGALRPPWTTVLDSLRGIESAASSTALASHKKQRFRQTLARTNRIQLQIQTTLRVADVPGRNTHKGLADRALGPPRSSLLLTLPLTTGALCEHSHVRRYVKYNIFRRHQTRPEGTGGSFAWPETCPRGGGLAHCATSPACQRPEEPLVMSRLRTGRTQPSSTPSCPSAALIVFCPAPRPGRGQSSCPAMIGGPAGRGGAAGTCGVNSCAESRQTSDVRGSCSSRV